MKAYGGGGILLPIPNHSYPGE